VLAYARARACACVCPCIYTPHTQKHTHIYIGSQRRPCLLHGVHRAESRLARSFSKVLYIVPLHSKHNIALIFQKLCQAAGEAKHSVQGQVHSLRPPGASRALHPPQLGARDQRGNSLLGLAAVCCTPCRWSPLQATISLKKKARCMVENRKLLSTVFPPLKNKTLDLQEFLQLSYHITTSLFENLFFVHPCRWSP